MVKTRILSNVLIKAPVTFGTPFSFDPGIAGLTMNSADAGESITLTNGDLTYENSASPGAAYQSVRATGSVSAGQWYWEVFIDNNNGSTNTIHGVMTSSGGLGSDVVSEFVGVDVDGWGFFGSGGWNAGSSSGSNLDFADDNDVLMFALDIANGKLWFGLNGSWNSSTPAVDGSGAFYTNLSGKTVFPAGSSVLGSPPQIATSRFKFNEFSHTIPTDFSPIGL